ncbi:MAG: hypothetical protein MZU95_05275 [Desulfomicrobium escambiense]|nr:hypothetical protein [Desulfomicrobium escambiense]
MIFGEKYGDDGAGGARWAPRRSCAAAPTSRRTGDIAFFKIASEESIAAGVRRIVAYTGPRRGRAGAAHRGRAAARGRPAQVPAPSRWRAKIEAAQRRREGAGAGARGGAAASWRRRSPATWRARAEEVGGAKVLGARRCRATPRRCASWPTSCATSSGSGVVALGARGRTARRCCWWPSPRTSPAR